MPHPQQEHEKTERRPTYQDEDEDDMTSLDDWELAVQGWFYEIMKGE